MRITKHALVLSDDMWDQYLVFYLDDGQEKRIHREAFTVLRLAEGAESFLDNIIAKEETLGPEFADALREYLRSTNL